MSNLTELKRIYNRRLTETNLTFCEWLRRVQIRSEMLTGVKPAFTSQELLDAILAPCEPTHN